MPGPMPGPAPFTPMSVPQWWQRPSSAITPSPVTAGSQLFYSSTAVQTTVAADFGTDLAVNSITGFPVQYPFTLLLEWGTANQEVVTVTQAATLAPSGAYLFANCARGADGTQQVAHAPGAQVNHGVSARDFLQVAPVFNVCAYGADPIGTLDSTQAIQAALTAARVAGGGTVYVPAGLYLISQTLQVGSNTTLTGDGIGATTIRCKASSLSAFTQVGPNSGAPMLTSFGSTTASRITVSGVTFDGNQANAGTLPAYADAPECAPIGLWSVTDLAVQGVEVINAIGYSVYIKYGTNFSVTGCQIVSGGGSALGTNQQDGIHVTDSSQGIISGNNVDTGTGIAGDDGIAVQAFSACSNIVIADNVIRSAQSGINLVSAGGAVTGIGITGNVIRATLLHGIAFTYDSGSNTINTVTISGNTLNSIGASSAGHGVSLPTPGAGGEGYGDVVILGNTFNNFNNSANGNFISAGQGFALSILNNDFDNYFGATLIQIGADAKPCTFFSVTGNQISSGSSTSGATGVTVADSQDGIISSNLISGNSAAASFGVKLVSTTNATTGIAVTGNRLAAWNTGAGEVNSGAQPDNNTFIGNECNGSTAAISVSGTHDIVIDPSGSSLTNGLTVVSGGVGVTAGGVSIGAGTTSVAPLKLTSGTNLTTPAAGAIEYDGTAFYATAAASSRQVADAEQFVVNTATRTFTANTSAQPIWTVTANGALTVAATTSYFFESEFDITGLSASSHTVSLTFGGTATYTSAKYMADVLSPFTAGTFAAWPTTLFTAATIQTIVASGTNTSAAVRLRGILRINGAGTVIPQITQGTASAAAVVGVNSWFRIWPVGSNTVTSVGNWS